jgi:hypothetical protein
MWSGQVFCISGVGDGHGLVFGNGGKISLYVLIPSGKL